MSGLEFSGLLDGQTASSLIFIVLLVIIFLYVARTPAHGAIRTTGFAIRNVLRLAARSMMIAEQHLRDRNKEVIFSAGREAKEHLMEREMQRVHGIVNKDLSGFPSFNRTLNENLTRIEEDYKKTTEVLPVPPEWLDAVESVAKIAKSNNTAVADILDDIHGTLERSQKDAMDEYRQSCRKRHLLLRRMLPYWRNLSTTMGTVESKISDLVTRIPAIDRHMQEYEELLKGSDKIERALSTSFTSQFLISGIVLTIALLGGFINFHLIALPMSEMVGGSSYVGPVKTADVAALVIILIEIAMGIFFMESLRITRMFPAIQAMDDHMRRRMIVVTFIILFALASVEAALAYMRDLLAADKEALTRSLSGGPQVEAGFRWIASVGQMVLGFILPFALTCAAIPLETFINSSRVVFGVILAGLMRLVVFFLRLCGNIVHSIATLALQLYDVIIFIPLGLERSIKKRFPRRTGTGHALLPTTSESVIRAPLEGNTMPKFQASFDDPQPVLEESLPLVTEEGRKSDEGVIEPRGSSRKAAPRLKKKRTTRRTKSVKPLSPQENTITDDEESTSQGSSSDLIFPDTPRSTTS